MDALSHFFRLSQIERFYEVEETEPFSGAMQKTMQKPHNPRDNKCEQEKDPFWPSQTGPEQESILRELQFRLCWENFQAGPRTIGGSHQPNHRAICNNYELLRHVESNCLDDGAHGCGLVLDCRIDIPLRLEMVVDSCSRTAAALLSVLVNLID
jgi:hypothetical protein